MRKPFITNNGTKLTWLGAIIGAATIYGFFAAIYILAVFLKAVMS
jgi:hypothetical protein